MYFHQQAHPEFPSAENTFTGLQIANAGAGNGSGLDKFMARDLGMGGPSAHPKDPSVPASFISAQQYRHPPQAPPTSQPPQPSSSFMQSAGAAVTHGASAPSVSGFNDGGVGVGFGTFGSEGIATYGGDPSGSYGPVPMAMPVSVTIPVPQGQGLHSRVCLLHTHLLIDALLLTSCSFACLCFTSPAFSLKSSGMQLLGTQGRWTCTPN